MHKISRENIEKWSLRYYFTKIYADFILKFFFPKRIVGLEKVDFNDILIFAPNHQNALIDALVLLAIRKWQPVFLARADIFKKPFINKILTFLKILPIYRIRDGYENLQQNNDVFKKTVDVLNNRNGLVILPEGSHAGVRRLRQLKKGIARIAFGAEDSSEKSLNIKIVPVGIEYSHYYKFGSPMLIRFGEPIPISDYYLKSKENYAIAIRGLIDELALRMKKEMIDIENEEFYDQYEIIRIQGAISLLKQQGTKINMETLFDAGKAIISALDELQKNNEDSFSNLMNCAKQLKKEIESAGFKEMPSFHEINNQSSLIFQIPLLLITLPVFLYGIVNNIFPLGILTLISSKIKDPQFLSSFRYVVGFLLFPIFYLIQTIVFALVSENGLWTLCYLASLPISFFLMQKWRKLFFSMVNRSKLLSFRLSKPKVFLNLKDNFRKITDYCKTVDLS